jgi:hypothetical protein
MTFNIPPKPAPKRRVKKAVVEKKVDDLEKDLKEYNMEQIHKQKNKIEEKEELGRKIEKQNKKMEEEYNKLKREKEEMKKQIKNKIENKVYVYKNSNSQQIEELKSVELPQKDFNLIKKNKKIIIKNPEIKMINPENFRLINRNFDFNLSNGLFNYEKNPKTKETQLLLLSFAIIDDKIFLNGWSAIKENKNGDFYIDLLNGYKGGGTNIIEYMKKYVGNEKYFYLKSLSTRATVDFYRKMGLKRVKEDLTHNIFIFPNDKRKYKSIIQKATDYDKLYEKTDPLFSRGSNFYYFPNKKVQEERYKTTFFDLVPTGREWIIEVVKIVLDKDEKDATKFVDELIKKTIKTKGKLEGTGKFLD